MKRRRRLSIVVFALSVAVAKILHAGECLELTGQWPYGPASAVALSGTRAFLGSGSAVMLADIGSATGIEVIATMAMPGVVEAIDVMPGPRALVAGSFGLRIVDFTVPEEPWIVSSLDTDRSVKDVEWYGSFAYAVTTDRLLVVDVTSGPNLSVYDRSDKIWPNGVSVEYPFAYVAAGPGGLYVFDVSQPIGIFEAGHIKLPGVWAVAVEGSIATVTSSRGYLRTVDVSQPDAPTEVGSIRLPSWTNDVTVVGSRAYVANHTSGLRIVDLSDPANPIELGSLWTAATSLRVAADGSVALLVDSTGFRRIAVDDPRDPRQKGFLSGSDETWSVVSDGGKAVSMEGLHNIRVFDVRPDGSLDAVGVIPAEGMRPMAMVGDLLYLIGCGSLRIVDVSDAENPRQIGSLDGVAVSDGVVVDGLAVLATSQGLRIVDVENPASPVLVGHLEGRARLVAVSGDLAFAVYSPEQSEWPRGTVQIVDIHDPSNPIALGHSSCEVVTGLAVSGDHVFASDGYLGLCVIDVSLPDQPVRVYSDYFESTDVAAAGNRAYVLGDDHSLGQGMAVLAFNVTNPDDPVLVRDDDLPGVWAVDPQIDLAGGHVFVAGERGGLAVYAACPDPIRRSHGRRLIPSP